MNFALCFLLAATSLAEPSAFERAVAELRETHGEWSVTTDFLKEDGSVAKSVQGTYRFAWVVPDRVLSGQSEIKELQRVSAILFYVNDKKQTIEMASVGADGTLWVMTGAAGSQTRTSQVFRGADGADTRLRFTRYNVKPDSFESKMAHTRDGGKAWLPVIPGVFQGLATQSSAEKIRFRRGGTFTTGC